MYSDYIEHYGVLNMKWGIRRYQPYPKGKQGRYLGKATTKGLKIAVNDYKATNKRKKAAKLNSKISRSVRTAKSNKKIAKYELKSTKKFARGNIEKGYKYEGKARKIKAKQAKKYEKPDSLKAKASKKEYKAQKIANKMVRKYDKQTLKEIETILSNTAYASGNMNYKDANKRIKKYTSKAISNI